MADSLIRMTFLFFRLPLCFTHLFVTKLGTALQHHEPERDVSSNLKLIMSHIIQLHKYMHNSNNEIGYVN